MTLPQNVLLTDTFSQFVDKVNQIKNHIATGGGGTGSGGASTAIKSYRLSVITNGQTNFTTPTPYTLNENKLWVFVNGSEQKSGVNFTETDQTHFTLTSNDLTTSDVVDVVIFEDVSVISGSIKKHNITGTTGQTVIDLPFNYTIGANNLLVFKNNLLLDTPTGFQETSVSSITLSTALTSTDKVIVILLNSNVLENNNTNLIATNYVVATEGQLTLSIPEEYEIGNNSLEVTINGSVQVPEVNYEETSKTLITFTQALHAGQKIYYKITKNMSGISNAMSIIPFYPTISDGQTLINLPYVYKRNTNTLWVYKNGALQIKGVDYNETSDTSITFTSPLDAIDVIDIRLQSASIISSSENFVINVKDFGANTSNTGEQNTDAFYAASQALQALGGGDLVIPSGLYYVGKQTFAGSTGLGYAYRANKIIDIRNCTRKVRIIFQGSKLKFSNNLKYASHDPVTGLAYTPHATGAGETITSIVGNGSIATVTTAQPHGLLTNHMVVISGAATAGYNVTTNITKTGANTFTYPSSTTGSSTGASYTIYAFVNFDYRADIGTMIYTSGNTGGVEIIDADLDGNLQNYSLGGYWGDTGRQCAALGIESYNEEFTWINPKAQFFGLDGLEFGETVTPLRRNRIIINPISRNNGRQAMSWIGGNGLFVLGGELSGTGRTRFSSAPGSGLDIECEGQPIRNGMFVGTVFADNAGTGVGADTGNSADVKFSKCQFYGTTTWAIFPNKPGLIFEDCLISGGIAGVFTIAADDPESKRVKFVRCEFTDGKTWGTITPFYTNNKQYDISASNPVFKDCSFFTSGCAFGYSQNAIYDSCKWHQQTYNGDVGLTRGKFIGNCEMNLYAGTNDFGVSTFNHNYFYTNSPSSCLTFGGQLPIDGNQIRSQKAYSTQETVKQYLGNDGSATPTINRQMYGYGTAACTWTPVRGDIIWNTGATSAGNAGWIYTNTGWKTFGTIA